MTDPATQQRIAECGKAVAIAAIKTMATGPSMHLPTLVVACARMSGSYLLRSFRLDLSFIPPGQAVLSEKTSERTQVLTRYCVSIMQTMGSTVPTMPPSGQFADIASKFKQDFLESQRALEPVLTPLKQQYALDDEEMAKAVALACGALIHQFAQHMEPSAGLSYASYGFAEGARTVPLKLTSQSDAG